MKKRLIRILIATGLVLAAAVTAFWAATRDTLWADLTGAEPTFHESWTESDRAHITQMLTKLGSTEWFPEFLFRARGAIRKLARTGDVKAHDETNMSPLHAAIFCGDFAFAKALVERGADVNVAFDLTVKQYASNDNLIERLLTEKKCYRETPLFMASCVPWQSDPETPEVLEQRLELIGLLIDRGADPDVEVGGLLPLEFACIKNKQDPQFEAVACLLIDRGADCLRPHRVGTQTWSRLQFGVQSGSPVIVSRMLAAGCDPNRGAIRKTSGQHTPPLAFLRMPQPSPESSADKPIEIIRLLLKHGAQINAKNDEDESTVLHMFAKDPCINLYGFSLTYDDAICTARHRIVQFLLTHGADSNIQDINGNTPLMNIDSINEDGEEISGNSTGPHGPALAQLLIDHGADLSIRNKAGEDAIAVHERLKHPDIVKTLKAAKAKQTSGEWCLPNRAQPHRLPFTANR